ncbi:MAG: hemolysin family protein [Culicoidibacterales bacterium]
MQLVIIVVLTIINALFSGAEMAIVSVNKNKLRVLVEEGNKNAIILEKLLSEPTKLLSTIQVGITLAGFLSSASAATGLAVVLDKLLISWNIPYSQNISLITITIILAYITLVFGELFPKRVALRHSDKIALMSANPVLIISKIAAPFVKVLSFSTNIMIRLVGMDSEDLEEQVSKEEIKALVEVGEVNGVFNESEKLMIHSIISFDDKLAKEVMTPRIEVFTINADQNVLDYMDEMLDVMYSRVPVYEGDIDNIIGILYMKDFIAAAYKVGFEHVDVRKIMHQPYFVPERQNIDVLFKELQDSKKHIAILIDEYGGFSGIVTIEDLIEEIMGEIEDEFDNDEPDIFKVSDSEYLIKGILHIGDLNEELGLNFDEESEEYDTIGGFLINLIKHIPDEDEDDIYFENFVFHIEEIKEKRIERVRMTIIPNKPENNK